MQYKSYSNKIFMKLKKEVLKFIWKQKRSCISKAIQSKKNISRGIALSNLKLYFRFIVTKIAQYWHKNRDVEQVNIIGHL